MWLGLLILGRSEPVNIELGLFQSCTCSLPHSFDSFNLFAASDECLHLTLLRFGKLERRYGRLRYDEPIAIKAAPSAVNVAPCAALLLTKLIIAVNKKSPAAM